MFIKMNPVKLAVENIKCTGNLLYGLNRQPATIVGFLAFIVIIIFAPFTMMPIMPFHKFGVHMQELAYQAAYVFSKTKNKEENK